MLKTRTIFPHFIKKWNVVMYFIKQIEEETQMALRNARF